MNRLILLLMLLISINFGCIDNKKNVIYKPIFTSFEVSESPSWYRRFSFLVDSNKIFFANKVWDTCYYGLMPDSVLKKIDSFAMKLKSGNIFKTIDERCDDCTDVAFKTVIGKDTFQIHQFGKIDEEIYLFINFLREFIKNNKHRELRCLLFLETSNINTILPPPIITKEDN
jgi:hypothetical protein